MSQSESDDPVCSTTKQNYQKLPLKGAYYAHERGLFAYTRDLPLFIDEG